MIVTRFIVKQCLLKIDVMARSVTADELARTISECVSRDYCIPSIAVKAIMRDGASMNTAAVRTLRVLYPEVLDITCFSYTLDNVGKHFVMPAVDEFTVMGMPLQP